MQENLQKLLSEANEKIQQTKDLKALDAVRVEYLGKQGQVTALLKSLGQLSVEERPKFGQSVNLAKETLTTAIEKQKNILEQAAIQQELAKQTLDITLPGRGLDIGKLHPITQTIERLNKWFSHLGFTLAEGPEIEDDFHNFEALNIPPYHPARAMHDTFYFPDGRLLRTHTSPVQIRAMQKHSPPFRLIAIGRVYRVDFDVTHTPMFHQLEGFMVDKGIHFTHLKGTLDKFLKDFFEQDLKTRFRGSYFPFTEPSAEIDIQCVGCLGEGCRICSQTGWLEILGCGMIHPQVLENCQIDSEQYTGFAFGLGIERLAMLRYNISDLRLFFENDLRFLQQF